MANPTPTPPNNDEKPIVVDYFANSLIEKENPDIKNRGTKEAGKIKVVAAPFSEVWKNNKTNLEARGYTEHTALLDYEAVYKNKSKEIENNWRIATNAERSALNNRVKPTDTVVTDGMGNTAAVSAPQFLLHPEQMNLAYKGRYEIYDDSDARRLARINERRDLYGDQQMFGGLTYEQAAEYAQRYVPHGKKPSYNEDGSLNTEGYYGDLSDYAAFDEGGRPFVYKNGKKFILTLGTDATDGTPIWHERPADEVQNTELIRSMYGPREQTSGAWDNFVDNSLNGLLNWKGAVGSLSEMLGGEGDGGVLGGLFKLTDRVITGGAGNTIIDTGIKAAGVDKAMREWGTELRNTTAVQKSKISEAAAKEGMFDSWRGFAGTTGMVMTEALPMLIVSRGVGMGGYVMGGANAAQKLSMGVSYGMGALSAAHHMNEAAVNNGITDLKDRQMLMTAAIAASFVAEKALEKAGMGGIFDKFKGEANAKEMLEEQFKATYSRLAQEFAPAIAEAATEAEKKSIVKSLVGKATDALYRNLGFNTDIPLDAAKAAALKNASAQKALTAFGKKEAAAGLPEKTGVFQSLTERARAALLAGAEEGFEGVLEDTINKGVQALYNTYGAEKGTKKGQGQFAIDEFSMGNLAESFFGEALGGAMVGAIVGGNNNYEQRDFLRNTLVTNLAFGFNNFEEAKNHIYGLWDTAGLDNPFLTEGGQIAMTGDRTKNDAARDALLTEVKAAMDLRTSLNLSKAHVNKIMGGDMNLAREVLHTHLAKNQVAGQLAEIERQIQETQDPTVKAELTKQRDDLQQQLAKTNADLDKVLSGELYLNYGINKAFAGLSAMDRIVKAVNEKRRTTGDSTARLTSQELDAAVGEAEIGDERLQQLANAKGILQQLKTSKALAIEKLENDTLDFEQRAAENLATADLTQKQDFYNQGIALLKNEYLSEDVHKRINAILNPLRDEAKTRIDAIESELDKYAADDTVNVTPEQIAMFKEGGFEQAEMMADLDTNALPKELRALMDEHEATSEMAFDNRTFQTPSYAALYSEQGIEVIGDETNSRVKQQMDSLKPLLPTQQTADGKRTVISEADFETKTKGLDEVKDDTTGNVKFVDKDGTTYERSREHDEYSRTYLDAENKSVDVPLRKANVSLVGKAVVDEIMATNRQIEQIRNELEKQGGSSAMVRDLEKLIAKLETLIDGWQMLGFYQELADKVGVDDALRERTGLAIASELTPDEQRMVVMQLNVQKAQTEELLVQARLATDARKDELVHYERESLRINARIVNSLKSYHTGEAVVVKDGKRIVLERPEVVDTEKPTAADVAKAMQYWHYYFNTRNEAGNLQNTISQEWYNEHISYAKYNADASRNETKWGGTQSNLWGLFIGGDLRERFSLENFETPLKGVPAAHIRTLHTYNLMNTIIYSEPRDFFSKLATIADSAEFKGEHTSEQLALAQQMIAHANRAAEFAKMSDADKEKRLAEHKLMADRDSVKPYLGKDAPINTLVVPGNAGAGKSSFLTQTLVAMGNMRKRVVAVVPFEGQKKALQKAIDNANALRKKMGIPPVAYEVMLWSDFKKKADDTKLRQEFDDTTVIIDEFSLMPFSELRSTVTQLKNSTNYILGDAMQASGEVSFDPTAIRGISGFMSTTNLSAVMRTGIMDIARLQGILRSKANASNFGPIHMETRYAETGDTWKGMRHFNSVEEITTHAAKRLNENSNAVVIVWSDADKANFIAAAKAQGLTKIGENQVRTMLGSHTPQGLEFPEVFVILPKSAYPGKPDRPLTDAIYARVLLTANSRPESYLGFFIEDQKTIVSKSVEPAAVEMVTIEEDDKKAAAQKYRDIATAMPTFKSTPASTSAKPAAEATTPVVAPTTPTPTPPAAPQIPVDAIELPEDAENEKPQPQTEQTPTDEQNAKVEEQLTEATPTNLVEQEATEAEEIAAEAAPLTPAEEAADTTIETTEPPKEIAIEDTTSIVQKEDGTITAYVTSRNSQPFILFANSSLNGVNEHGVLTEFKIHAIFKKDNQIFLRWQEGTGKLNETTPDVLLEMLQRITPKAETLEDQFKLGRVPFLFTNVSVTMGNNQVEAQRNRLTKIRSLQTTDVLQMEYDAQHEYYNANGTTWKSPALLLKRNGEVIGVYAVKPASERVTDNPKLADNIFNQLATWAEKRLQEGSTTVEIPLMLQANARNVYSIRPALNYDAESQDLTAYLEQQTARGFLRSTPSEVALRQTTAGETDGKLNMYATIDTPTGKVDVEVEMKKLTQLPEDGMGLLRELIEFAQQVNPAYQTSDNQQLLNEIRTFFGFNATQLFADMPREMRELNPKNAEGQLVLFDKDNKVAPLPDTPAGLQEYANAAIALLNAIAKRVENKNSNVRFPSYKQNAMTSDARGEETTAVFAEMRYVQTKNMGNFTGGSINAQLVAPGQLQQLLNQEMPLPQSNSDDDADMTSMDDLMGLFSQGEATSDDVVLNESEALAEWSKLLGDKALELELGVQVVDGNRVLGMVNKYGVAKLYKLANGGYSDTALRHEAAHVALEFIVDDMTRAKVYSEIEARTGKRGRDAAEYFAEQAERFAQERRNLSGISKFLQKMFDWFNYFVRQLPGLGNKMQDVIFNLYERQVYRNQPFARTELSDDLEIESLFKSDKIQGIEATYQAFGRKDIALRVLSSVAMQISNLYFNTSLTKRRLTDAAKGFNFLDLFNRTESMYSSQLIRLAKEKHLEVTPRAGMPAAPLFKQEAGFVNGVEMPVWKYYTEKGYVDIPVNNEGQAFAAKKDRHQLRRLLRQAFATQVFQHKGKEYTFAEINKRDATGNLVHEPALQALMMSEQGKHFIAWQMMNDEVFMEGMARSFPNVPIRDLWQGESWKTMRGDVSDYLDHLRTLQDSVAKRENEQTNPMDKLSDLVKFALSTTMVGEKPANLQDAHRMFLNEAAAMQRKMPIDAGVFGENFVQNLGNHFQAILQQQQDKLDSGDSVGSDTQYYGMMRAFYNRFFNPTLPTMPNAHPSLLALSNALTRILQAPKEQRASMIRQLYDVLPKEQTVTLEMFTEAIPNLLMQYNSLLNALGVHFANTVRTTTTHIDARNRTRIAIRRTNTEDVKEKAGKLKDTYSNLLLNADGTVGIGFRHFFGIGIPAQRTVAHWQKETTDIHKNIPYAQFEYTKDGIYFRPNEHSRERYLILDFTDTDTDTPSHWAKVANLVRQRLAGIPNVEAAAVSAEIVTHRFYAAMGLPMRESTTKRLAKNKINPEEAGFEDVVKHMVLFGLSAYGNVAKLHYRKNMETGKWAVPHEKDGAGNDIADMVAFADAKLQALVKNDKYGRESINFLATMSSKDEASEGGEEMFSPTGFFRELDDLARTMVRTEAGAARNFHYDVNGNKVYDEVTGTAHERNLRNGNEGIRQEYYGQRRKAAETGKRIQNYNEDLNGNPLNPLLQRGDVVVERNFMGGVAQTDGSGKDLSAMDAADNFDATEALLNDHLDNHFEKGMLTLGFNESNRKRQAMVVVNFKEIVRPNVESNGLLTRTIDKDGVASYRLDYHNIAYQSALRFGMEEMAQVHSLNRWVAFASQYGKVTAADMITAEDYNGDYGKFRNKVRDTFAKIKQFVSENPLDESMLKGTGLKKSRDFFFIKEQRQKADGTKSVGTSPFVYLGMETSMYGDMVTPSGAKIETPASIFKYNKYIQKLKSGKSIGEVLFEMRRMDKGNIGKLDEAELREVFYALYADDLRFVDRAMKERNITTEYADGKTMDGIAFSRGGYNQKWAALTVAHQLWNDYYRYLTFGTYAMHTKPTLDGVRGGKINIFSNANKRLVPLSSPAFAPVLGDYYGADAETKMLILDDVILKDIIRRKNENGEISDMEAEVVVFDGAEYSNPMFNESLFNSFGREFGMGAIQKGVGTHYDVAIGESKQVKRNTVPLTTQTLMDQPAMMFMLEMMLNPEQRPLPTDYLGNITNIDPANDSLWLRFLRFLESSKYEYALEYLETNYPAIVEEYRTLAPNSPVYRWLPNAIDKVAREFGDNKAQTLVHSLGNVEAASQATWRYYVDNGRNKTLYPYASHIAFKGSVKDDALTNTLPFRFSKNMKPQNDVLPAVLNDGLGDGTEDLVTLFEQGRAKNLAAFYEPRHTEMDGLQMNPNKVTDDTEEAPLVQLMSIVLAHPENVKTDVSQRLQNELQGFMSVVIKDFHKAIDTGLAERLRELEEGVDANKISSIEKQTIDKWIKDYLQRAMRASDDTTQLSAILNDPAVGLNFGGVQNAAYRYMSAYIRKEAIKRKMTAMRLVQAPGNTIAVFDVQLGNAVVAMPMRNAVEHARRIGALPYNTDYRALAKAVFAKQRGEQVVGFESFFAAVGEPRMLKHATIGKDLQMVEAGEVVVPSTLYKKYNIPADTNLHTLFTVYAGNQANYLYEMATKERRAELLDLLKNQLVKGLIVPQLDKATNTVSAAVNTEHPVAKGNNTYLDNLLVKALEHYLTSRSWTNDTEKAMNGRPDAMRPRVALETLMAKYDELLNSYVDALLAIRVTTEQALAVRTPSGPGSGTLLRVVGFANDNGSYAYVSSVKNAVDGSDYDVDQFTLYYKYASDFAIGKSEEETTDDVNNKIMDLLFEYYRNVDGTSFSLAPIKLGYLENAVSGGIATLMHGWNGMHNIAASFIMRQASMEGQTVGPFALAQKGQTFMYTAERRNGGSDTANTGVLNYDMYSFNLADNQNLEEHFRRYENIPPYMEALVNAATDNPKLTLLGQLNIRFENADMVSSMFFASADIVNHVRKHYQRFGFDSPAEVGVSPEQMQKLNGKDQDGLILAITRFLKSQAHTDVMNQIARSSRWNTPGRSKSLYAQIYDTVFALTKKKERSNERLKDAARRSELNKQNVLAALRKLQELGILSKSEDVAIFFEEGADWNVYQRIKKAIGKNLKQDEALLGQLLDGIVNDGVDDAAEATDNARAAMEAQAQMLRENFESGNMAEKGKLLEMLGSSLAGDVQNRATELLGTLYQLGTNLYEYKQQVKTQENLLETLSDAYNEDLAILAKYALLGDYMKRTTTIVNINQGTKADSADNARYIQNLEFMTGMPMPELLKLWKAYKDSDTDDSTPQAWLAARNHFTKEEIEKRKAYAFGKYGNRLVSSNLQWMLEPITIQTTEGTTSVSFQDLHNIGDTTALLFARADIMTMIEGLELLEDIEEKSFFQRAPVFKELKQQLLEDAGLDEMYATQQITFQNEIDKLLVADFLNTPAITAMFVQAQQTYDAYDFLPTPNNSTAYRVDLGTAEGRRIFVGSFASLVRTKLIPAIQEAYDKGELPNETLEFAQRLDYNWSGKMEFVILRNDLTMNDIELERLRSGFASLPTEIKNLFTFYQLAKDSFNYQRGTLAKVLDTDIHRLYTTYTNSVISDGYRINKEWLGTFLNQLKAQPSLGLLRRANRIVVSENGKSKTIYTPPVGKNGYVTSFYEPIPESRVADKRWGYTETMAAVELVRKPGMVGFAKSAAASNSANTVSVADRDKTMKFAWADLAVPTTGQAHVDKAVAAAYAYAKTLYADKPISLFDFTQLVLKGNILRLKDYIASRVEKGDTITENLLAALAKSEQYRPAYAYTNENGAYLYVRDEDKEFEGDQAEPYVNELLGKGYSELVKKHALADGDFQTWARTTLDKVLVDKNLYGTLSPAVHYATIINALVEKGVDFNAPADVFKTALSEISMQLGVLPYEKRYLRHAFGSVSNAYDLHGDAVVDVNPQARANAEQRLREVFKTDDNTRFDEIFKQAALLAPIVNGKTEQDIKDILSFFSRLKLESKVDLTDAALVKIFDEITNLSQYLEFNDDVATWQRQAPILLEIRKAIANRELPPASTWLEITRNKGMYMKIGDTIRFQNGMVGRIVRVADLDANGKPRKINYVLDPTRSNTHLRAVATSIEQHLDNGNALVLVQTTVKKLMQAFPNVEVEFVTDADAAISGNDAASYFSDGKVYINLDRADAAVAIHEFAHPWVIAFRSSKPGIYARMIATLQDTSIGRYVQTHYANEPRAVQEMELLTNFLQMRAYLRPELGMAEGEFYQWVKETFADIANVPSDGNSSLAQLDIAVASVFELGDALLNDMTNGRFVSDVRTETLRQLSRHTLRASSTSKLKNFNLANLDNFFRPKLAITPEEEAKRAIVTQIAYATANGQFYQGQTGQYNLLVTNPKFRTNDVFDEAKRQSFINEVVSKETKLFENTSERVLQYLNLRTTTSDSFAAAKASLRPDWAYMDMSKAENIERRDENIAQLSMLEEHLAYNPRTDVATNVAGLAQMGYNVPQNFKQHNALIIVHDKGTANERLSIYHMGNERLNDGMRAKLGSHYLEKGKLKDITMLEQNQDVYAVKNALLAMALARSKKVRIQHIGAVAMFSKGFQTYYKTMDELLPQVKLLMLDNALTEQLERDLFEVVQDQRVYDAAQYDIPLRQRIAAYAQTQLANPVLSQPGKEVFTRMLESATQDVQNRSANTQLARIVKQRMKQMLMETFDGRHDLEAAKNKAAINHEYQSLNAYYLGLTEAQRDVALKDEPLTFDQKWLQTADRWGGRIQNIVFNAIDIALRRSKAALLPFVKQNKEWIEALDKQKRILSKFNDRSKELFAPLFKTTKAMLNGKETVISLHEIHWDENDPETAAALKNPNSGLTKTMVSYGKWLMDEFEKEFAKYLFETKSFEYLRKTKTEEEAKALAAAEVRVRWKKGMLPAMPRRYTEAIAAGEMKDAFSLFFNSVTRSENVFDEYKHETHDRAGYERLTSSFWTQFQSADYYGGTSRLQMLGLTVDENGALQVVDEAKQRDLSYNLENMGNYAMAASLRARNSGDAVDAINTAMDYLNGLEKTRGVNTESIREQLETYINRQVYGDIPETGYIKAFGTAIHIDNAINTGATFLHMAHLAASPILSAKNALSQGIKGIVNAMTNDLAKTQYFKIGDVRAAAELVFHNPKLAAAINEKHQFVAMSERDLINHMTRVKTRQIATDTDTAMIGNFVGDYYTQLIGSLAQMHTEGALNAYSLNANGELVYDIKKDTRFYNANGNQTAIQKLMMEDLLQSQEAERIHAPGTTGYSQQDENRVKTVAQRYVGELTDGQFKNRMTAFGLSRLVMNMRNYLYNAGQTWWKERGAEPLLGFRKVETNEQGEQRVVWSVPEAEGILQTIAFVLKRLAKADFASIKSMDELRRRNLVGMAMFAAVVGGSYLLLDALLSADKEDEENTLQRLHRQIVLGALNEQFTLFNPTRIWTDFQKNGAFVAQVHNIWEVIKLPATVPYKIATDEKEWTAATWEAFYKTSKLIPYTRTFRDMAGISETVWNDITNQQK